MDHDAVMANVKLFGFAHHEHTLAPLIDTSKASHKELVRCLTFYALLTLSSSAPQIQPPPTAFSDSLSSPQHRSSSCAA
jgi:hypothetical protein